MSRRAPHSSGSRTAAGLNIALKLAILQSGEHQFEIADRAGLSVSSLSRIVRGHRPARPTERRRLAAVLHLKESRLFPKEKRPAPATAGVTTVAGATNLTGQLRGRRCSTR